MATAVASSAVASSAVQPAVGTSVPPNQGFVILTISTQFL
jgi:hypothetical protein